MAAATLIAPRYSAEDFETTSIHSAAPSYVSEVPSYHSRHHELPPYSPPARRSNRTNEDSSPIQYGLPPIPDTPVLTGPNLHNFRVPTWSTHNAPAARQYRSVIERRAAARSSDVGRHHHWASLESGGSSSSASASSLPSSSSTTALDAAAANSGTRTPRPLEDPWLVGEEAAAEARRERLRRENGDDILLREDKHWDWLLAQMESWEARERSWQKYHREVVDRTQRRSLLRSVRGRLRG